MHLLMRGRYSTLSRGLGDRSHVELGWVGYVNDLWYDEGVDCQAMHLSSNVSAQIHERRLSQIRGKETLGGRYAEEYIVPYLNVRTPPGLVKCC